MFPSANNIGFRHMPFDDRGWRNEKRCPCESLMGKQEVPAFSLASWWVQNRRKMETWHLDPRPEPRDRWIDRYRMVWKVSLSCLPEMRGIRTNQRLFNGCFSLQSMAVEKCSYWRVRSQMIGIIQVLCQSVQIATNNKTRRTGLPYSPTAVPSAETDIWNGPCPCRGRCRIYRIYLEYRMYTR
jgi:hypothetical protein